MKLTSLAFFAKLKWLDGSPLLNHVEPYRRQLFSAALDSGKYNLVLAGRSKKNWKSADLCLAALYALVTDSPGGNQCYLLANDLDQAGDDLSLCKALVECNPVLSRHVVVKQKVIERRDGRGFLLILPAGDIAGSHGKTFRFCGWDEVHGYKSWDLFEALQPDPHRQDVLQWVSTYASLYHRPGVPLFDLFQQGKAGSDPKMLFSWYSGSYTTDPDLDLLAATAEEKANPSRGSWTDPDYLLQQQRRLPSHVYRRLHLCEPGLPSGSAYSVESIEDAIARNVRQRPPAPGIVYYGFVDMSGGSNDGAAFGVSHLDAEGRALLDYVGSQGQRAPFDPDKRSVASRASASSTASPACTGTSTPGNARHSPLALSLRPPRKKPLEHVPRPSAATNRSAANVSSERPPSPNSSVSSRRPSRCLPSCST